MTFIQEKIIAALVVLLFVAGLFFTIGSRHERQVLTAQYEKQIAGMTAQQNQALTAANDALKTAQAKQVGNIKAAAAADQQHQLVQVKTRTIYQTIHDQVIKYVKANPAPAVCNLDADKLRTWNEANQGATSDTTGAAAGDSASHDAGQVPAPAAGQ